MAGVAQASILLSTSSPRWLFFLSQQDFAVQRHHYNDFWSCSVLVGFFEKLSSLMFGLLCYLLSRRACVLEVLQPCPALVTRRFYGFLYQVCLGNFAGMWILISNGILLVGLIIAIALHFGMKKSQEWVERDNKMENLETKLP